MNRGHGNTMAISLYMATLIGWLGSAQAYSIPSGPFKYKTEKPAGQEFNTLAAAEAALRNYSTAAQYVELESETAINLAGGSTLIINKYEVTEPPPATGDSWHWRNNVSVAGPFASAAAAAAAEVAGWPCLTTGPTPSGGAYIPAINSTWDGGASPPAGSVPPQENSSHQYQIFEYAGYEYSTCSGNIVDYYLAVRASRDMSCPPGLTQIQTSHTHAGLDVRCYSPFDAEIYYFSHFTNPGDPGTTEDQTNTDQSVTPGVSHCTEVGNPCDVATGAKVEIAVDYAGPGPVFVRTYRSNLPANQSRWAGLGDGWTHNYAAHVVFDRNNNPQSLFRPDGTTIQVERVNSEYYRSTNGTSIHLIQDSTFFWTVYLPSGAKETYRRLDVAPFGKRGVLIELRDPAGRITTVNRGSYWMQNEVLMVIGPFGHVLDPVHRRINQTSCDTEPCLMQLTRLRDPAGREIHYGGGQYMDPEDPATWEWDLKTVQYQDGNVLRYVYDKPNAKDSNFLVGIVNENGDRYASFYYNAEGLARSTWRGNHTRYQQFLLSYTDGYTTVTDQEGHSTRYHFDGNDGLRKLARISNLSDGLSRHFEYDDRQRLTALVDENGVRTTWDYDDNHLLTRIDAAGSSDQRVTSFEYLDATNSLATLQTTASVTLCQNAMRHLVWDYHAGTQLVRTVTLQGVDPRDCSPLARTVTYSDYNQFQQPRMIDGPRNDVDDHLTLMYWEPQTPGTDCRAGGNCGQIREIRNALGHAYSFSYQPNTGLLRQTIDPNQLVTTYSYDSRDRVTSITQFTPDGNEQRTTSLAYQANGLLASMVFPNGRTREFTWNDAMLLESIKDNLGNEVERFHDARGNLAAAYWKNMNGATRKSVVTTFDARNNLAALQLGSTTASSLAFDALGNLILATNPNLHATEYIYDAFNRLIVVNDPENGPAYATRYEYDSADRVTSVSAPNGTKTTYRYDDLGNLLAEHSPDRGVTLYGHDSAGNVTCLADGRFSTGFTRCEAVPERRSYVYDALNRLVAVDYQSTASAAPDLQLIYDAPGQLGQLFAVHHEAEDGTVVDTHFEYDGFGNLAELRQFVPGSPAAPDFYTTGFQYDADDELALIRYPSGRLIDYARNAIGQITQITMYGPNGQPGTTLVANVQYEPFGEPARIKFGNGLASIRDYDLAGRVTLLALGNNNSAWDIRELSYDNAGNIVHDADWLQPANTRDYRYDALNRVIDDSRLEANASVDTYTYDPNGNRLGRSTTTTTYASQLFTYGDGSNASNRMSTRDGQLVSHDGAGNLVDDGAGRRFTYNAANRLATIHSDGDRLTILYNGLGQVARTTTKPNCPCGGCANWEEYFHFAPDGTALGMAQKSSSGTVVEWDWVWLDDIPIAQIQESYLADGTHVGTEITYLHADHLGTPRLGTDRSRNITWRFESDAFGQAEVYGSTTVRLRLPGQIDYGVGRISYNYFRDYDASIGRYIESDPIGLPGGTNTYAYAALNPLVNTDRNGLFIGLSLSRLLRPLLGISAQEAAVAGKAVDASIGAAVLPIDRQRIRSQTLKAVLDASQAVGSLSSLGLAGAGAVGASGALAVGGAVALAGLGGYELSDFAARRVINPLLDEMLNCPTIGSCLADYVDRRTGTDICGR